MTYQLGALSDGIQTIPQLPAWITCGRVETLETVAFRSRAPHTFVTTETFLATFDLQSLRDLPELELPKP